MMDQLKIKMKKMAEDHKKELQLADERIKAAKRDNPRPSPLVK
jgi:hypothetical protein